MRKASSLARPRNAYSLAFSCGNPINEWRASLARPAGYNERAYPRSGAQRSLVFVEDSIMKTRAV